MKEIGAGRGTPYAQNRPLYLIPRHKMCQRVKYPPHYAVYQYSVFQPTRSSINWPRPPALSDWPIIDPEYPRIGALQNVPRDTWVGGQLVRCCAGSATGGASSLILHGMACTCCICLHCPMLAHDAAAVHAIVPLPSDSAILVVVAVTFHLLAVKGTYSTV